MSSSGWQQLGMDVTRPGSEAVPTLDSRVLMKPGFAKLSQKSPCYWIVSRCPRQQQPQAEKTGQEDSGKTRHCFLSPQGGNIPGLNPGASSMPGDLTERQVLPLR